MFARLMSLTGSNGLWWRIVAVIVAVIIAVIAGNRLLLAKNYETIHSMPDAGVVDTVSVRREQLFNLVDQQHRELAAHVGETGVLRLSNAGEIVTEENWHAWIGAHPVGVARPTWVRSEFNGVLSRHQP